MINKDITPGLLEKTVGEDYVSKQTEIVKEYEYEYGFIVNCEDGLHARPSSKISRLLRNYFDYAEIFFQRANRKENGKIKYKKEEGPVPISVLELLMHCVKYESIIYIRSKKEVPKSILDDIKDVLNSQNIV